MAKIPSNKTSKFPKVTYDLLKKGDYDARLVRFVGLGVQEQPAYQGQAKAPAFKCALTFELIDTDAVGHTEDGETTTKPACMFVDYFLFPGAKRGKVFELCEILEPGIESVPEDMDWFKARLGSVVNIKVGSYMNKKTNTERNCVDGISPIPAKYQAGIGAARSETVFFDPYEDNEGMFKAYSDLYPFQREQLTEAKDSDQMPFAGKEPAKKASPTDSDSGASSNAASTTQVEDDDKPF